MPRHQACVRQWQGILGKRQFEIPRAVGGEQKIGSQKRLAAVDLPKNLTLGEAPVLPGNVHHWHGVGSAAGGHPQHQGQENHRENDVLTEKLQVGEAAGCPAGRGTGSGGMVSRGTTGR